MELQYYKKYEPIFGEYYIKKELGEGSSGKVFEIERKDLSGSYSAALKVITIPSNRSQIDMVSAQHKDPSKYYESIALDLQSEVEMMAELKGQSNIVSYENHKFIQHEDMIGWDILIQMELLTPLYRYALIHDITEKDVIKLGIDICSALELCHKHSIIHRDVKPENIFLTLDGDYKLGDFGIAKVFEGTRSGTRIGTDSFMAPEVFNYRKYGISVDIYSLGMVMYTLLNEHLIPFEEKSTVGTRGKRLEANNRRMMGESLPPPLNATKELSEIILKATEYRVEDRYKSASEMKRALLKLEGVPYLDEEIIEVKRKPSKKIFIGIAAMLIVIAAAIFAFLPKDITEISGIGEDVTILYGETKSFDYEISPKRFSDEPLDFEIKDDDIALVSSDGKIKAKNVGETELVIKAKGYTKKVNVTVKAKVERITGVKDKYTLSEGDIVKLNPDIYPEKYKDIKVKYYIKNKKVATISSDGKLKGIKEGQTEATIFAGGKSRNIKVIVKAEPETINQPSVNTNSTKQEKKVDEDLSWE